MVQLQFAKSILWVQLKHMLRIILAAILCLTARQLYWVNRVSSSIVDYTFESPQQKPWANFGPMNVLIFYPDDMRHDSLEDARGPEVVLTPFLSKLARQGIRFTHNAVTTSI